MATVAGKMFTINMRSTARLLPLAILVLISATPRGVIADDRDKVVPEEDEVRGPGCEG